MLRKKIIPHYLSPILAEIMKGDVGIFLFCYYLLHWQKTLNKRIASSLQQRADLSGPQTYRHR